MSEDDFPTFREELSALAGVIGRRLNEDVALAYFRALEELPLAQLVRELRRRVRTVESGARLPTPGELRVGIASGAATARRCLTDAEAGRVRARITEAMDEWEQEGAAGSAWPTFELAWQAACRAEGLARAATAQNRQDAWQRWLSHGAVKPDPGPRVTNPQKAAILRDVMGRHARGEYAPGGPRSGMSAAEVEHWQAHWATEDARTGRWKNARPMGRHSGFTRLGDTIMDVFEEIAARHEARTDRDPGEDG